MTRKNYSQIRQQDRVKVGPPHCGVWIYVDLSDGSFYAEIQEEDGRSRWVNRKSKRDLEVLIERACGEAKTLKAIFFDYYGARVVEVVSYERGRFRTRDGGLLRQYSDLRAYDDEVWKQMEELKRQISELDDQEDALRESLPMITPEDLGLESE